MSVVKEVAQQTWDELTTMTNEELRRVASSDYGLSTDFMSRLEIMEQIVKIEVENYFK